ncbi:class I SAM-dependent methyltransferase [Sphingomonas daechungensis]|uniref:class I SAM-dependent methyltransferase n=1 Tax=Sphingomonas daechungensis TaxID=1176646 RepID=UPI0037846EA0
MASIDVRFSGSVPANYEQYMVPLLFRPYAEEIAKRVARFDSSDILETAAGTGVVTAALAASLPEARIVATDLNQPMLDVAATRVKSENVRFQQADALQLPLEDESFDLVVCQFGVMFYPDKVRGNAEARRVLRDAGRYVVAIWDRVEENKLSNLANESMRRLFPENPPQFMTRGPFSYHDPEWIRRDLRDAGFGDIEIETVELTSRSPSAVEGARGLVYGSPMGVELADYGPDALDRVFDEMVKGGRAYEGPDGFAAPMRAHIVTATR